MDDLILSLLLKVKLFFCGPSTSVDFEINFKDLSDDDFMELELRISGISLNDDLIDEIDNINFGDGEILKSTGHTDLFTIRQVILDLKGKLHFAVHDRNEIYVHVIIPRKGKPEGIMRH